MCAFAHTDPGVFQWIDAPRPALAEPCGALPRPIAVSPRSSDVHTIDGGKGPKIPNLIMGRECVAEVVEGAQGVRGFRMGSHVPIVPPAHLARDPVDVIPIIAPGYTDEIAGILRRDFRRVDVHALRGRHLEHYE